MSSAVDVGVTSEIATAIRNYRFRYSSEEDLQEAITYGLTEQGYEVRREVVLDGRSRIDMMVDRVGIEVKVAGSLGSVFAQMRRYARSDLVDGFVLVTNRSRHGSMPREIEGKPVEVVSLVAGGL